MRTPDELVEATRLLLQTAGALDDAAISAPSLLPGWTRGHVLAHLARNADGFVNLLTWARTGTETPMYPSREQRDADIEEGSARPAAAHVEDLRDSAERLRLAWETLDETAGDTKVRVGSGRILPARDIPSGRIREIEIHLVDLDCGLSFADLPPAHVDRYLAESVALFAARQQAGEPIPAITLEGPNGEARGSLGEQPRIVVRGSTADLVAWLTGRSDGGELTAESADGPVKVPALPAWA